MVTEAATTPVLGKRARTRRACDKCSNSRARCDGLLPCRRCQEYGHMCQYDRDLRKRGRKPGVRKQSKSLDEATASRQSLSTGDNLQSPSTNEAQSRTDTLHSGVLNRIATPFADSLWDFSATGDSSMHNVDSSHVHDNIINGAGDLNSTLAPHVVGKSMQSAQAQDSSLLQSGLSETPGHSNREVAGGIDEVSLAPETLTQDFAPANDALNQDSRSHGCLSPLLPMLEGIIDAGAAGELLDFYFAQPGSSLFRSASPYVLTHVIRKKSLLHSTRPRPTSIALLCTMLWVSAQTADIPFLLLPGERIRVCESLRRLCMQLTHQRDLDNWARLPGGDLVEERAFIVHHQPTRSQPVAQRDLPVRTVDDVLNFPLLCIVISGSDFKNDCQIWWNKAMRLMYSLGLNRKDMKCATCRSAPCTCRGAGIDHQVLESLEAQEEGRRVFWLLFCLDRHLALSYNSTLCIGDDECGVYIPLPEEAWANLERAPAELLAARFLGPPTTVTGIGFFEWFLPLMAILGDVIQVHHRKLHPRFGVLNDDDAVNQIEATLAKCAQGISEVEHHFETVRLDGAIPASEFVVSPSSAGNVDTPRSTNFFDIVLQQKPRGRAQAQLVTAYSTFILHVLHVLLHGQWDAVSMLDNDDGWISSVAFGKCASHAISASEAVERILRCDPELTFTPYLFGIYLLHGSFILLLFADRMTQLGLNESVEKACETIIRAHEVCVVTLSTEFQKSFRKVLRSTLYSVRNAGPANAEESKARRRALSLYRWTKGARGLAL